MNPRTKDTILRGENIFSIKIVLLTFIGFIVAIGAEVLSEAGISILEKLEGEMSWAESKEALIVGIIVGIIAINVYFF